MEELGVKQVIREEKKTPTLLTGILALLLIASYIFTLKDFSPANNIHIMGNIMLYPFTFLIVAYISRYYGFKEARKTIFNSSLLYILFMLMMMVCVVPNASNTTAGYNAVIQYLFTNNFILVSGNFRIFYPMLGQFFSVIVAFLISHILYATIYNAVHRYTVDYLAVGLSLFIAYIIDRIIFMPILFAEGLIKGTNTFNYFIACLTSEFMASILASLLIMLCYFIISIFKKNR